MATVNIDRESLVCGLDWVGLSVQTDASKQKRDLCSDAGSRIGCSITDRSGIVVVGLPRLGQRLKRGQVVGAATLASSPSVKDLILIQEMAGDPDDSDSGVRYWFCAIKNGSPVRGFDEVCALDDARDLLANARDGIFDEFDFCSNTDQFDDLVDDRRVATFAELVLDAKKVKTNYLTGVDPRIFWVAGSICSLALVGFGANTLYKNHQAKELELQEQQNMLQAQERDSKLRQEALDQQRAGLIKEIASAVLERPSVEGYLQSVWAQTKDLPTVVSGWEMGSVDCGPRDCVVEWKRTKTGLAVNFLKSAEAASWDVMSVGTAVINTKVSLSLRSRDSGVGVLHKQLPFLVSISDAAAKFQLVGGRSELPSMVPLIKADSVIEPEWSVGTLLLQGVGLHTMRAIPEYFESPGMAVRKVRFEPSGAWSAELDVAAKI